MGKDLNLTPRARIVTCALTGTEPTIMLAGPVPATQKALAKAGLTVEDIDLFELNEAFAAVVLGFQKDLAMPDEKINVNGGAIAMGHPIGATGGMVLGTLLDELERRNLKRGLVTLCAGIMHTKTLLRRLETLGVPIVCGINGPALGGGFEIALACHHRLALKGVVVGLPEAQIGLMPGADGIVRMVRYVGMQEAIGLISTGKRLKAEAAVEKGLINELFDTEADMHAAARAWIKANPEAQQPWDQDGFKIPGARPLTKTTRLYKG